MELGWGVVREFMDVLSQVGRKNAIYRGQANSEWELTPSIFRPGAIGISHPNHLSDWQRRASRFASPLPRDEVEWLVLAQHYGLATALLDWSTSPLVALYFACADESQTTYTGAVWLIMQSEFDEPRDNLMVDVFGNGETREKPFLINAVGRNARSTAQDSFLSLHTSNDYQTLKANKIFEVDALHKSATLTALGKLGLTDERLHFDITKMVQRFKSEMAGRRIVV